MIQKQFETVSKHLTDKAQAIMDAKQPEYTLDSVDVLANFKKEAEENGITPLQVWGVYFGKHVASIKAFVKDPNRTLSEPIDGRFADTLNYLKLGYALASEMDLTECKTTEVELTQYVIPAFPFPPTGGFPYGTNVLYCSSEPSDVNERSFTDGSNDA